MYALPTAAADVVLSAHLKLAYELILCVYSNCLAEASCNTFLLSLRALTHSLTDLSSHDAVTHHGWLSRAILLQGLLSPLEVHLAWLGPHHHGLKVRLWKGIYQLKLKPSKKHAPD